MMNASRRPSHAIGTWMNKWIYWPHLLSVDASMRHYKYTDHYDTAINVGVKSNNNNSNSSIRSQPFISLFIGANNNNESNVCVWQWLRIVNEATNIKYDTPTHTQPQSKRQQPYPGNCCSGTNWAESATVMAAAAPFRFDRKSNNIYSRQYSHTHLQLINYLMCVFRYLRIHWFN